MSTMFFLLSCKFLVSNNRLLHVLHNLLGWRMLFLNSLEGNTLPARLLVSYHNATGW